MVQCSNVLLDIDQAHTLPQGTLDCRPGLSGLNQAYIWAQPSHSIGSEYLLQVISTSLPDVQM